MTNLLKNFTLQKVIGGASPKVLQEYFHNRDLFKYIHDFYEMRKHEKSTNYKKIITNKILSLESEAGNIVTDFKKIFVLASEKALHMLIDRIGHINEYRYLMTKIEEKCIEKDYDKVFFFLESEPEFISKTYLIYSLNNHTEGYWNRRHTDISKKSEDITSEEIENLRVSICNVLQDTKRGKNCHIQHILFDGKDHLFVMAEDMAVTMQLWQGDLAEDVLVNPSFDLAFVYDRYEGELDVCCVKGGRTFRNKMELAFSKAILGREIQELREDDEIYDLHHIQQQLLDDKKVDFCTHVSKKIEDIFIRAIKLKARNLSSRTISLDTGLNQRLSSKQDDIYSEIEDFMKTSEASPNTVDVKNMQLIYIEFRVVYKDSSTKEISKKKFSISGRSGCNLGFEGIDKEIRECMKAAGIQLSRFDCEKQKAA